MALRNTTSSWQRAFLICGSLVLVVAAIYFARSVLVPVVLKQWAVQSMQGLTSDAERARDQLLIRLEKIRRAADRLLRREQQAVAAT